MATQYQKCETREVVITQPGSTVVQVTSTVTNPLMPRGNPRDWHTGICSCFEDIPTCLLGLFLGPCHQCCIATDMGENCCVPCCVPNSLITMRTQIRGRHNIQGTILTDCCLSTFLEPCAQCQLAREVKAIKAGKAQA
ncbi:cornifelin-like [Lytechinus variegatus]|uniref:cornifelin-like n=1 Tax=Lytechinus variegatus TaxID=7654 RepID=UPI001BB26EEA|nr:cornifelin-like [Lytechinus variegatus]XP_041466991.1 cornifelin-like [Lytechinus variegatus]